MGNRLSKTDTASGTTNTTASTYDAANRLLTTAQNGGSASAYANDADGNTLTGGGRTNAWDSQNRLVSCAYNSNASTYTYGADGLRRSETVNGVTTYYVYDGQTMVREMQRNVTTGLLVSTATYFTGPRGAEYRRDDNAGTVRWYVYDGLGSVVGEVDPSGNLTSSPKYDVYGGFRSNSGTATSKHGFVGGLGHMSEAETGLIYMKARYYDPSNGRFMSEDTTKNGNNWFAYCNANPVNQVDRNGKSAEHATDQAITFFAGWLMLYAAALIATGCAEVSAGMALIKYGESISELGDVVSGVSPSAGASILLYGSGIQMAGAGSAIGGAAQLSLGLTLQSIAIFCLLDSDDVSSADVGYYSSLISKS